MPLTRLSSSGYLLLGSRGVPFLVNVRQGIVDFAKLRSQVRQVAANIGGNLFAAVYAGIFLDVRGHFFADGEVMAEDRAEELLHKSRFWGSGRFLFVGLEPSGALLNFSSGSNGFRVATIHNDSVYEFIGSFG